MSKLHSQLAFEEIKTHFQPASSTLVETQPFFVSNAQPALQPARQVVKVKGSITVSF